MTPLERMEALNKELDALTTEDLCDQLEELIGGDEYDRLLDEFTASVDRFKENHPKLYNVEAVNNTFRELIRSLTLAHRLAAQN